MLSSLVILALAAAPVELTVVQSVPLRTPVHSAKAATQRHAEPEPKRTISTAVVDSEGNVHVRCAGEDHLHNDESKE